MLSILLDSHRNQFNAIANAWLAAGATAFGVWHDERLVHLWPEGIAAPKPTLMITMRSGKTPLGELGVVGLEDGAALARLRADAMSLSRLAEMEVDFDSMTDDLITAQDQQLALYELTRSTRLHLDIENTLQYLAQEATRLVAPMGAILILAIPDRPIIAIQHPRKIVGDQVLIAVYRDLLSKKELELLLDADEVTGNLPMGIDNFYLRSIQIRDQTVAALGLLLDQPVTAISPSLKLGRALAEQAGAQIENVLLHEETITQAKLQTEMELARDVQIRLLPQSSPDVPGLDVWGRSHPALQVGGDFFDYPESAGDHFIFTVGDVSGKGMSAALLMSMTRSVIRHGAGHLSSPSAVIEHSISDLYDDLTDSSAFITLFIAYFQPETREFCYANAGHSPVIFCPHDGAAQLLEADGPPVGVLSMNLCEDQSLSMRTGDVLVIATDGFSEAQNPEGEMFGYDRLLSLIESAAHQPAASIGETMFETIHTYTSGQPQGDDETLVVIKAVP